jgi:hypothetical protein
VGKPLAFELEMLLRSGESIDGSVVGVDGVVTNGCSVSGAEVEGWSPSFVAFVFVLSSAYAETKNGVIRRNKKLSSKRLSTSFIRAGFNGYLK